MYTLEVTTLIRAPQKRCFDLARDIQTHVRSAEKTGEQIVGDKTTGLLEFGDTLTFEARHLGLRQRLTAQITAFDPPHFFQDRMLKGAFASLEHDHRFDALPDGTTRMTDAVRFAAPLGPIGWLAERLVIARHLRRFLTARGEFLRGLAEDGSTSPAQRDAGSQQ